MQTQTPVKLFNRNFCLLWQGQLVSQLGSQAFAIAMMFWIKHETGSASLMGLLMMLSMLPSVILGPIAGTVADHYSRRKIIIVCDLLSGVGVSLLALVMLFSPAQADFLLAGLFAVSLLIGILKSFFNPAISAAIPDLVPKERISAANSLNQSSVQISTFVGQGLGGYLFVLLGAPVLFLVDGLSYLFSAASESFITIPQRLPEKSSSWRQKLQRFKSDLVAGFRFAWNNPGMRALFFMATFLNFFVMPIILLLPFYVEDFLNVSPAWYGYILAVFGLGSLLGYGVAGAVNLPGKIRALLIVLALILMSSGMAAFAVVDEAVTALLLMLTVGILNGYININIITLLQITTSAEMRGRIFGLLTTLTAGLMPISMALGGIIGDLTQHNIPLIYGTCGSLMILFSILTAFSPAFRNFLAYDNTESAAE